MASEACTTSKGGRANRNSALFWLPRIEGSGLPVPRTIVVPYDHPALVCALEDGQSRQECEKVSAAIASAAVAIGLPVFLRTDLAAAKHSGPDSYRIDSPWDVNSRMCRTVEDNELKFWPHAAPAAFLVREFLHLDTAFVAFDGLPIAREFRFFATPERVECWHPYWPEDSISFYSAREVIDWQRMLAKHHEKPDEFDALAAMAVKAATLCDGEFSVDFARDVNGKWWLTDMATAEDSWHWEGCDGGSR